MIIGFDCFNFAVRQGYVIHDNGDAAEEALKACCEKPSQLILLKTREQLDEVPVDYLLGIYTFFTGKKMKYDRIEGDKKALRESVRQVFDVSKLKIVEAKPDTTQGDTKMAAKATKKTASKKAAKKAAPKTAGKKAAAKPADGAKRGRAPKFSDDAKLHGKHKENVFRGTRGEAYGIILAKPGITVAEYVKKGGGLGELLIFTNPKYEGTKYDAVRVVGNAN